MDWEWGRYPHIPLLITMKPSPRLLLGQQLYWTEKKDGSNIAVWFEEIPWKKKFDIKQFTGDKGVNNWAINGKVYALHISSRNQIDAVSDLDALVRRTEEFPKILELLHEYPQFVLYIEACRKGRSITGIEVYERDICFLFDIYDVAAKKFLPYVNVHQHAFHHKIPVVKLYATTRHRSMKSLLKFRNHVLEYCEAMKIEGMVIKAYRIPKRYEQLRTWREFAGGLIQAKVKLDIPEPKKRKIERGEPIYPPIPDNEVMGAIDKVWQELGTEAFRDVSKAMPLVAKYVNEECTKHFYSDSKRKLFGLYKEYLERMVR